MRSQSIKDFVGYFSAAQKAACIILFFLSILLGVTIPVLLPNSSMRHIELSRDYRAGELSDEDGSSLLNFFKNELVKVNEIAGVETFVVYQSCNLEVPYLL